MLRLALLACFAVTSIVAHAQQSTVSTIPNDDAYFVTLFGTPGEPAFEKMRTLVHSETVKQLAANTNYSEITTNTPLYQARFKTGLKTTPAIRIQKPDGTVVYQKSGASVPTTVTEMTAAFRLCPRFDRQAPPQQVAPPQQQPVAPPDLTFDAPSDGGDTVEDVEPEGLNPWIVAAIVVIGGGGAAGVGAYGKYKTLG